MKLEFKITAFIMMLVIPLISFAQITTKKVDFAPGKSSITINSVIVGGQIINYVVSANENQVLKVSMKIKEGSCYFNILPPANNVIPIFVGSNEGNSFGRTLSKSGIYKIRVYQMINEGRNANFSLDISVTGLVAR